MRLVGRAANPDLPRYLGRLVSTRELDALGWENWENCFILCYVVVFSCLARSPAFYDQLLANLGHMQNCYLLLKILLMLVYLLKKNMAHFNCIYLCHFNPQKYQNVEINSTRRDFVLHSFKAPININHTVSSEITLAISRTSSFISNQKSREFCKI